MKKKQKNIKDAGLATCIRHIGPNMKINQNYDYNQNYPYEKIIDEDDDTFYIVTGKDGFPEGMIAPTFKLFFKILDNNFKNSEL